MKKILSATFFLLLLNWMVTPQLSKAQVILDSCISKARKNYPLIRQYDLIESTREYNLSNANKSYLPQLSLNFIGGVIDGFPSFTPGGTESTSTDFNLISIVQFNQLIWDGGITKANKQIAESKSAIEKADLEVNLYALESRINNLFFGILLIDEQYKQLELLRSRLERNKNRVQTAIDNGIAYKSDLQELEVELINTDQKMDQLSYNRKAYLDVLSAMIGEPINSSESFQKPELFQVNNMGLNRPELERFNASNTLVEARSQINKSSLYPKFGLLGFGAFITPGADFGASQLTRLLVAGVNVSWSISGLYKNGNNKKLSDLDLLKIETQRETFLFNTDLDLRKTNMMINQYSSLLEKDLEIVDLKISIRESYQMKYDNGVETMSSLLDRINDENVAKQNLIQHDIQLLMSIYEYKNKSGN